MREVVLYFCWKREGIGHHIQVRLKRMTRFNLGQLIHKVHKRLDKLNKHFSTLYLKHAPIDLIENDIDGEQYLYTHLSRKSFDDPKALIVLVENQFMDSVTNTHKFERSR